jgi:plastocyanin
LTLQAGLWLLVTAAIGAAACSSSDEQSATIPATTLASNAPFTITQKDFSFDPNNISVAANTKFEMDVRNNGSVAHTFTITDTEPNPEGLASNLDQVIQPGGRTTIVYTVKNDVTFFCRFHRNRGMAGLLQVTR